MGTKYIKMNKLEVNANTSTELSMGWILPEYFKCVKCMYTTTHISQTKSMSMKPAEIPTCNFIYDNKNG